MFRLHHCPTCGGPVTVEGDVTKFYRPAGQKEILVNLASVMIAAAEEISQHWEAHCDEEGYGPVNLMRRLEEALPVDYNGYRAGEFTKLRELLASRDDLLEEIKLAMCDVEDKDDLEDPEILNFYIGVCIRIKERIDTVLEKQRVLHS